MRSSVGSALSEFSDEREEGEIVDDDFEDISDNSIILPVCTGKSDSDRHNLRALSLSSVSDLEEELCPKPKRRRSSNNNKRGKNLKRRKKTRYKSTLNAESDSDYQELDRKLQEQLKAAVHVEVEECHKNSLRTRLKAMTNLESNITKELTTESETNKPTETELDMELMELRTEALRTALLNKFKDKKRKKVNQEKCILSTKTEENETNKENAINNVDGNNQTLNTDIKPENTDQRLSASIPISPEEDEDVLRALLLASMSKKITSNVSEKTESHTDHILNVTGDTNPKKEICAHVNKLKINRIINRKQTSLTNSNPIGLPQVKPLIINLNTDSDTDEEISEEILKGNKKPLDNINAAIENTVDKFLKEQRAKIEAEKKTNPIPVITTPIGNKKRPEIIKSAVKLLPKNKQIEYQKLLLKLKNAERKPRLRKTSTKLTDTKSLSKNNGMSLKSKLNKSKLILDKAAAVNKLEKSQEQKNEALLLHNTLKNIQVQVNGRLQIQDKYKFLKPFIRKINECSKERKKCDQDVKHLLEELAEAKKKQLHSHHVFTLSVQELIVQKKKIDSSSRNNKLNADELPSTIHFTSTPVKESPDLNHLDVSLISSTNSMRNSQNLIPAVNAKNHILKQSAQITKQELDVGDPNDIDEILKKEFESNIAKYVSPLDAVKSNTETFDPFSIMCPFEVDGKCKDSDCTYKHFFK